MPRFVWTVYTRHKVQNVFGHTSILRSTPCSEHDDVIAALRNYINNNHQRCAYIKKAACSA